MTLNGMKNVTYGDVWCMPNSWSNPNNFELADTDMLFKLFDNNEEEAKRVCAAGYV